MIISRIKNFLAGALAWQEKLNLTSLDSKPYMLLGEVNQSAMSRKSKELHASFATAQRDIEHLAKRHVQLNLGLANICTIINGEESADSPIMISSINVRNFICEGIKHVSWQMENLQKLSISISEEIQKEDMLAEKRLQKRTIYGGMFDFDQLPLNKEKIRSLGLTIPPQPMTADELNSLPRSEAMEAVRMYRKNVAGDFIMQLNNRKEPKWGTANIIRKLTTILTE